MSVNYFIEPYDRFSFNESFANDVIIRDTITKDNRLFLGEAYFADTFAHFYDGNTQSVNNLTSISFPPYGIIGNSQFISILSNDIVTIVEPPTTFESNVYFAENAIFSSDANYGEIEANTISCNNANVDAITSNYGNFDSLIANTITSNYVIANTLLTTNLYSNNINSSSLYIDNLYCNTFMSNVAANIISCNDLYSNSLYLANYALPNIGTFDELTSNNITTGNVSANTVIGNICFPFSGNLILKGPATLTNLTVNTATINQLSGNSCNIGLLTSNSINSQTITSNFACSMATSNFVNIQNSMNTQETQIMNASGSSANILTANIHYANIANVYASIMSIDTLTSNTANFQELNSNATSSNLVSANSISLGNLTSTNFYSNIANSSTFQANIANVSTGNIISLSSNICNITQSANFKITQISSNLTTNTCFVNIANITLANISNSSAQTASFVSLENSFLSTQSLSSNMITISNLTTNTLTITDSASIGNIYSNTGTTQTLHCTANNINSNSLTISFSSNEQSSFYTNATFQTITTGFANVWTLDATTINGNLITANTANISYNSNASSTNFTNANINLLTLTNTTTVNKNITGNNLNSNILSCITVTGNVANATTFTAINSYGNNVFACTIESGIVNPIDCVSNTCNVTNSTCTDFYSSNVNAATIDSTIIAQANTIQLGVNSMITNFQSNSFLCNSAQSLNFTSNNANSNTLTIEQTGTIGNLNLNTYIGNLSFFCNTLIANTGTASSFTANTLTCSNVQINTNGLLSSNNIYANLSPVLVNTTNFDTTTLNCVSLYANTSTITCGNATITGITLINNVTTINTVVCGVLTCADLDFSGDLYFSNINASSVNCADMTANNINALSSLSIGSIQSNNVLLSSLSGTYGTCDTITSDSIQNIQQILGSLTSNTISAQATTLQDVDSTSILCTTFNPSDLESSKLSVANLTSLNAEITQQISVNNLNLNNFSQSVSFEVNGTNICTFSNIITTNMDVIASSISMETALNSAITLPPSSQTGLLLTEQFVDSIISIFSSINTIYSQYSNLSSSFLNLNYDTMPIIATITSAIVFSPVALSISGSNPVNISGTKGMFSSLLNDNTTHAIICDSYGDTLLAGVTKSSDNNTLTIQIDNIGTQIFIPFVEILSMVPTLTATYSSTSAATLVYTVPIGLTYFGLYIASQPSTSSNLLANNMFLKTIDIDISNSNFCKVVIDNGSIILFYQRFSASPPTSIDIVGEVTLLPATSSTTFSRTGDVYLDSNSNIFMTALTSNISSFLKEQTAEPSICPIYRIIAKNGALSIQSVTMPPGYISGLCPYDIIGTPNTSDMSILLNNNAPINNCNCIIQDFTNASATLIPGSNMIISYGSNISYDSLLFANITSQANTYYVDANNMVYSLTVQNVYHYWGIYNDNSTPPNIFPVEGISFISISDAQNIFNSYSPYQWTTITQSGSLTNQSNGPVNTNSILSWNVHTVASFYWYHYCGCIFSITSGPTETQIPIEAISMVSKADAENIFNTYVPANSATQMTAVISGDIEETYANVILQTGTYGGNDDFIFASPNQFNILSFGGIIANWTQVYSIGPYSNTAWTSKISALA